MPHHRFFRALFVVIAGALFWPLLPAQAPRPIFVAFDYGSDLVFLRGSAIEHDVGDALVDSLTARFPYRLFQRGDATSTPLLRVWLRKAYAWDLCVALGSSDCTWHLTLFTPADMDALNHQIPSNRAMVDVVNIHFGEWLETKTDLLRAALLKIPLGADFDFIRPIPSSAPQAVLAKVCLPWNRYSTLGDGYFRVDMNGPQGVVSLYSFGARKPEHCQSFDGIRVVVREWEFGGRLECIAHHVSDLPGLRPQGVFLMAEPNRDASGLSVASPVRCVP
jgi:hypothetical protein